MPVNRKVPNLGPRLSIVDAKGKRIAAVVLETTPDKVEFDDGRFSGRETNRTFDFLELAKEAARHTLPDDLKDGIAVVTGIDDNTTAACRAGRPCGRLRG